jgi:3-polyprenyl-4-hydroxybenzoate decarboxylase
LNSNLGSRQVEIDELAFRHFGTPGSAQLIFIIEAITYREDPTWALCAAGRPVDDPHLSSAATVG